MPVVTFSAEGRDNCVVIAGTPYVYATVGGRGFVMRARCPHRGGPLHLAGVAEDGVRLVCPWHERKTSVARMRAEVPAVRVGGRVTAVFPERPAAGGWPAPPQDCAVGLEHRPLAPALSRPSRAG
ncbi:Rieske 2Fe-2S domain-containing protein [Streptomyces sp. NPDC038707]|uniref:Rieske domain-containing protein n=1 Tax=Streptomyces achromogenes subsp. streptozoticus TaxID=285532 RepID=A0A411EW72_STRC2|nr:rieske domain-containing protein [Streptomyces achromogenes subsp. streptozoticus]QBA82203.1 rieske domain-containing protein [Streptomyces achromogenes subsp. streptozoticus]